MTIFEIWRLLRRWVGGNEVAVISEVCRGGAGRKGGTEFILAGQANRAREW